MIKGCPDLNLASMNKFIGNLKDMAKDLLAAVSPKLQPKFVNVTLAYNDDQTIQAGSLAGLLLESLTTIPNHSSTV